MKKFTFLKMMFLAVVMMAGSVSMYAATATITINFTSVGGTTTLKTSNYDGGAERTWTQSGIDFGGKAITGGASTNAGTIQAQANNGVIYNKTAFPGRIVSITLTQNGTGAVLSSAFGGSSVLVNSTAADYTVTGGTQVGNPSATGWTSTDFGSTNYLYFAIKRGGSAAYFTSIVIEYETSSTLPNISVSPTTLTFGDINLGSTSATQTVIVTGSNLTGVPTANVDNPDFTVTGTLTATGGTLEVSYKPSAAGLSTGKLIVSGEGGLSATVNLSGTGVIPPLAAPVATAASNVSQTGFTANWDAVANATSYDLNVYTKTGTAPVEKLNEIFTWTGTGGNDDKWSGSVASTALDPASDLIGWTYVAAYKGSDCVKMGTGSTQGVLTTPELGFTGDGILSFRAGAWNNASEQTELLLEISGGGSLDQTSVTLVKGAFSDYTILITGATPTTQITFKGFQASNSRFFLDDVIISEGGFVSSPVTSSPFTGITTTSYDVTGLSNADTYYYTVVAHTVLSTSPASNEIGPVSLVPTGIFAPKADAHAWTSNGKVMLQATAGETIEVYNIAGQKVVSRIANDGLNTVDVTAKGVVIVKAGNRVSKVIL